MSSQNHSSQPVPRGLLLTITPSLTSSPIEMQALESRSLGGLQEREAKRCEMFFYKDQFSLNE